MGIRIQTAAGWGMSIADYNALTLIKGEDGAVDALYDHLGAIEELIIPKDVWSAEFESRKPGLWTFEGDLLNGGLPGAVGEHLRKMLPEHKRLKTAKGLFECVSDSDETHMILFWPDARAKHDLYRFNDDLDYLFCIRHPKEPGGEIEMDCETMIQPLHASPYPWSNDIQKDGVRVQWPGLYEFKTGGYEPAPPRSLVWWLVKLGVFTEENAMKLRPYLCRWWC